MFRDLQGWKSCFNNLWLYNLYIQEKENFKISARNKCLNEF